MDARSQSSEREKRRGKSMKKTLKNVQPYLFFIIILFYLLLFRCKEGNFENPEHWFRQQKALGNFFMKFFWIIYSLDLKYCEL